MTAIPLLMRRGGCGIKKISAKPHLSAADGVVAHTDTWLVSDHPGRCRGLPSSRGKEYTYTTELRVHHRPPNTTPFFSGPTVTTSAVLAKTTSAVSAIAFE
jgi:hypothetical protein